MNDQRREGTDPAVRALTGPGRAEDGPVMDRVKMLLFAVLAGALGFVLLEGFTTLYGLYPSTRTGYLSPSERAAVAEVGACRRLGPLSVDGFGYWWECEVAVRVEDGRVVHAVVDRSIVTPADEGRKIDFRESSKGAGSPIAAMADRSVAAGRPRWGRSYSSRGWCSGSSRSPSSCSWSGVCWAVKVT